jgi:hypothetical protein
MSPERRPRHRPAWNRNIPCTSATLPRVQKALRDGQKADAMHLVPKMWQLMGTVLANKGDFAGAAENFRKYLEYAPMATDAAKTKEVLAEVEKRAAAQPK